MPHRTATSRSRTGPWLTSLVMWANYLRYVGDGISVRELEARARTRTNLDGMRRWGYVTLEPYADGWRASVPKPETLPHAAMVLHRGGCPDGS